MANLAELLRQGADKLVNLPIEAQRFVTNPQAFIQLLTGKNALPRETGFAAGATGLPAQQGTVLDPNYQAYMQGYEQGEPVSYAAMATPAALPVAKALAPKAGQMAENYMVNQGFMPSLIAYHGTPHTIKGKFDISKVGTGEGAQAYGHGMYFAESPDVAKAYATDRSYVGKFMAGTPDNTPWDAQRIAQDTLNVHGNNAVEQLQKTLKANSYSKNPQQVQANKQLEDAIDILKTNQLQPTGNLYKVDIPDEYIPNMLDYDKPLNQQTNIINNILSKNSGFTGQTKREIQELVKQGAKGEDLIKLFGKDQKELSEELSNLGIKGIRYKDAMSRGADDGTSNFVVFDPAQVKILEQNSKPMTRKEIIENQIKTMQNAGD